MYTYNNNCRIGEFQTFYENDNYKRVTISCFDSKDRLISFEEKGIFDEKELYFYSNSGVLTKIDYYEKYSTDAGYRKVKDIKFKILSGKHLLNTTIAEKINSILKN